MKAFSGFVILSAAAILVTAAGVACLYRYAALHRRYGDVENWVETPAEVRVQDRYTPPVYSSYSSHPDNLRSKVLDADYTYQVDGIRHHGHTVSAHGTVERDRLPATLRSVFYNPAHPGDAVLIREPVQYWPLTLIGFIDAILIAFGLSYVWIRMGWRRLNARIAASLSHRLGS